jgi:hypothetical protein
VLKGALEERRRNQERRNPKSGQKEQVPTDCYKAAIFEKNALETMYSVGKGIEAGNYLQPLWQS